jgi:ribose 5-phosphate isomerase
MLTGVVEVGLFCNMARAAYFGNEASRHTHTHALSRASCRQD